MTEPQEAFREAVVQTFAPELRRAMYGHPPRSEEALKDRLSRELEGRGFKIVEDDA